MTIFGRIDGSDPLRSERIEHLDRRVVRSRHVADGTLACPACDAPVALTAGPVSPAHELYCPVCDHTGAARDFLSLARPTRPARVAVRVVAPA